MAPVICLAACWMSRMQGERLAPDLSFITQVLRLLEGLLVEIGVFHPALLHHCSPFYITAFLPEAPQKSYRYLWKILSRCSAINLMFGCTAS